MNYYIRSVQKGNTRYDIETIAIDLDQLLYPVSKVRAYLGNKPSKAKGNRSVNSPQKLPSKKCYEDPECFMEMDFDNKFTRNPKGVMAQYNFSWNLRYKGKYLGLPPNQCLDIITPESVF
tara:strand:- start:1296 stop:1655 length:360 start_codon:yes stop_codon:yes gene_type:complete